MHLTSICLCLSTQNLHTTGSTYIIRLQHSDPKRGATPRARTTGLPPTNVGTCRTIGGLAHHQSMQKSPRVKLLRFQLDSESQPPSKLPKRHAASRCQLSLQRWRDEGAQWEELERGECASRIAPAQSSTTESIATPLIE